VLCWVTFCWDFPLCSVSESISRFFFCSKLRQISESRLQKNFQLFPIFWNFRYGQKWKFLPCRGRENFEIFEKFWKFSQRCKMAVYGWGEPKFAIFGKILKIFENENFCRVGVGKNFEIFDFSKNGRNVQKRANWHLGVETSAAAFEFLKISGLRTCCLRNFLRYWEICVFHWEKSECPTFSLFILLLKP